jgi:hypothetical protein
MNGSFQWHSLGYGGRVDVEDFNGRRIRIGGVNSLVALNSSIGPLCGDISPTK